MNKNFLKKTLKYLVLMIFLTLLLLILRTPLNIPFNLVPVISTTVIVVLWMFDKKEE